MLKVRFATDTDKEAWDAYVLKSCEGTAYQLFGWGKAIEVAYRFQMNYLLAERGNGICGIMPLIDFRIPLFGNSIISLPYCDAGGLLADDQEVQTELVEHARKLAEKKQASIKIRSFGPISQCGQSNTDKVSMVLELQKSSDQMLADFKSSLRSQIRKPLRDGLTVQTGGSELVDKFYGVFSENMRYLGSPVHALAWFHAIVEAYSGRVLVAVVLTPDKVPAAAGIILMHPSRVSIPWASSLRRFNSLNPNMLLYWTLLAFAADNGFCQFDFGRSTPGEGTFRFKSQWGAQCQQLYWYEEGRIHLTGQPWTKNQLKSISMQSTGRQVATTLWRKLPQCGANLLGPGIRKYISL